MPLMIGNNKYRVVTPQKASDAYDLDTYLNFYMPFGGTITLRRTGSPTVVELEYSTDGGRTWQIWEEVGNDRTLTLPVEGRMWIRNTSETSTRFSTSTSSYYYFYSSDYVYGDGDIMSLLCKNPEDAVISNYCFVYLFYQASSGFNWFVMKLLSLPKFTSKTLAKNCYRSMFYCNTYVMNCDTLMAETPSEDSLSQMFRTTKIQRVVLRLTSISDNVLGAWLMECQSFGDLYCDPNLTLPTGSSGIPEGWTRHDLSELNN